MRNWLKKIRRKLSPENLEGPLMGLGNLGLLDGVVGVGLACIGSPWAIPAAVCGFALFVAVGKLTERDSLALHRLFDR